MDRITLRDSEDGIFLLVFAGILIALMCIVGLAVDSATMFRARLALQSAADAGAVSGVGYIASHGVNTTNNEKGRLIAERVAAQNLRNRGLTVNVTGAATYTTDTTNANPQIVVRLRAQVELYILGLVPALNPTNIVAASSEAEIFPATVSLLLDTSDSMACSSSASNSPYCGCTSQGTVCDAAQSKLKALQDAAKDFVDYFDKTRDRINLIAYNTGAKELVPFQSDQFDETSLKDEIDGFSATGLTNHCDALLQAYLKSETLGALDSTSYVLFTDGAPTAARFWFKYNPFVIRTHGKLYANNVLNYRKNNVLLSKYDFYNWAYRVDSYDPNLQGDIFQIIPSRLLPTKKAIGARVNWTPYNYAGPNLPAGCPHRRGDPGDQCPQCSFMTGFENRPAFGWLCHRAKDAHAHLDGLAPFYTPDGEAWGTVTPIDVAVDPARPAGNSYRWWKRYYECAIAMSDTIRKPGGLLFTIGLGVPPLGDEALITSGPYQNVADVWNRKDGFLRRMAFDTCGSLDPAFPDVQDFQSLTASQYRNGMSLVTTDASDLKKLFRSVAVKIRTRLVN